MATIRSVLVAAVLSIGGLLPVVGCEDYRSCGAGLWVRGILVDSETGTALTGAEIAGQVFTQGERTGYGIDRLSASNSVAPPLPAEVGSFELAFNTGDQYPCPRFGPLPFPRPDQVEVILVREACIQRFLIDINDVTAMNVDGPDEVDSLLDVIELKDPILVPPCVE